MSAIDELFQKLRRENKRAFMPFVTAGDPDLGFTAEVLQQLDAAGCHLVELGIPYSDPIADGPTIQASYTPALNGGTKLDAIFETVSGVSGDLSMPVVTMVSYAIVFRMGIETYLDRAIAAGVSGLIVPDMPVDESAELAAKCAAKRAARQLQLRVAGWRRADGGRSFRICRFGLSGRRARAQSLEEVRTSRVPKLS